MQDDLKQIKKHYGEDMMKYVRKTFPTIIENNKLFEIMNRFFYPCHYLFKDLQDNDLLDDFENFINNKYVNNKVIKTITDKTPFELLKEANYELYECKTNDDIQKFKKYYKKNEVLCTFNDDRISKCFVFFAIKNNADILNRDDFKSPSRQDEYGTSVISIQFSRDNHYLSIKNRYNHTVNNPDATFSNDLDKIVDGLEYSFEKYYNLKTTDNDYFFDIPNYVLASNNKYYKYNIEINNRYYCLDNIIVNCGLVDDTYNKNKERYLLFDYFILDLKHKKLFLYDNKINDSFLDINKSINRIIIDKTNDIKKISLIDDNNMNRELGIKDNALINYVDNNTKYVDLNFLYKAKKLKSITMNNLEFACNCFLRETESLEEVHLDKLKIVENYAFEFSRSLRSISLPSIVNIGAYFLESNEILNKINIKNVEKIGTAFLSSNRGLTSISLPNCEVIESCFLYKNINVSKFYAPKLSEIGKNSLTYNKEILFLYLPNILSIGDNFMQVNNKILGLYAPTLLKIGNEVLRNSINLSYLNIRNIRYIGYNFIEMNRKIRKVDINEECVNNSPKILVLSNVK